MVEGDPLPKVLPSHRGQKRQKGNLPSPQYLLKLEAENLVAYLHRWLQTSSIRNLDKIHNYILPYLGTAKINNKIYFFYLSHILTETEKVCVSVTKKSLAMLCDHCRCSPVPSTTLRALLEAFMSSFESHQRCYKFINRAETDELSLAHL